MRTAKRRRGGTVERGMMILLNGVTPTWLRGILRNGMFEVKLIRTIYKATLMLLLEDGLICGAYVYDERRQLGWCNVVTGEPVAFDERTLE